VFEFDLNQNGASDVGITIAERRNSVPAGGVAIDPGGVPQQIFDPNLGEP